MSNKSKRKNQTDKAQTDKLQTDKAQKPEKQVQDDKTPNMSQAEKEHETYLKILDEYENYKKKRFSYRKYGSLFIILSGIIFLTLMFSLESKMQFLILWVVSCFYCAALMIRADYKFHKVAGYLGMDDE